MGNGKYREWLTPEGLLKIEGWARDGLMDEQIAQRIHRGQPDEIDYAVSLYGWHDLEGNSQENGSGALLRKKENYVQLPRIKMEKEKKTHP